MTNFLESMNILGPQAVVVHFPSINFAVFVCIWWCDKVQEFFSNLFFLQGRIIEIFFQPDIDLASV